MRAISSLCGYSNVTITTGDDKPGNTTNANTASITYITYINTNSGTRFTYA